MRERYEDLIAACALHFQAYEEYLLGLDRYADYGACLDAEEPGRRAL